MSHFYVEPCYPDYPQPGEKFVVVSDTPLPPGNYVIRPRPDWLPEPFVAGPFDDEDEAETLCLALNVMAGV